MAFLRFIPHNFRRYSTGLILGTITLVLMFHFSHVIPIVRAEGVHAQDSTNDLIEIVVEEGILLADGPDFFDQNSVFIVNGGSLQLNGFNFTMSSLSGGGGEVVIGKVPQGIDNTTLTIDQDTDTTYRGDIIGPGYVFSRGQITLVKDGAGALTLTGDGKLTNTYNNGGVRVNGGELALAEGGTFRAHWLLVGTDGKDATMRVVGNGTEWQGTSSVSVGSIGGRAEISVEDGGLLESKFFTSIGDKEGSDGRAILTGGSRWNNDGDFYVGDQGVGSLAIAVGSIVESRDNYIGAEDGSVGTVTVEGVGSKWLTSEAMIIGKRGFGTINILDGGVVNVGAYGPRRDAVLGLEQSSSGRIELIGADSFLSARGVFVGYSGHGEIIIRDEAQLDSYELIFGENEGAVGTGVITGGRSVWDVLDEVTIGAKGTGTLTLADGGTLRVRSNNFVVARDVGSLGTLRIGDGGAAGYVGAHSIAFGDGDGTLEINHTESNYSFDVRLVGGDENRSRFRHLGGTTRLTADNSGFGGQTEVIGGTLLVDGGLGGTLTVKEHGTLGGTGTVGSTVIMSGGTLAAGNSIGTLTIEGDLTLFSNSIVEMELGRPGTAADPASGMSDRIVVTGDLTLDGTLNLLQSDDSADGEVGFGYYRLMTYGGVLADNGLEIGTTPEFGGSGYELINGDGRIDLFVAALGNDTLQHWQGGDGVWNAGDENWVNEDGEINVVWAGNHAVFKNEPGGFDGGTIAVEGVQRFLGIQFVDDGFVLTGDGALETHGDGSEIRVLADRVEINTDIIGTGGIVKTEGGTLVLSGMSTYTGDTTISGGTLQVADDANLGAASGRLIFRGGTLRVTENMSNDRHITLDGDGTFDVVHSGAILPEKLELHGIVTGGGALHKTGKGKLVLTNATNDYSGGTTVTEGVVTVKAGGALGTGPVKVQGNYSLLYFDGGTVNADELHISALDGGDVRILNGASGGAATFVIDEDSRMLINVGSDAGTANIANAGHVVFQDNASAQHAMIDNRGGLIFNMSANAGEAYIVNRAEGLVRFEDGANADSAALVNATDATVDISSAYTGVSIGSLSGNGEVFIGDNVLTLGALGFDDVFDGEISDAGLGGGLVKTGTGTLTLTGDHGYTGATEVTAGRLIVIGSITSSSGITVSDGGTIEVDGQVGAMTVRTGGMLGGSGTVGGATIESGGILAPGNSIGTFVVDGDLTMDSGSVYRVEVNPEGHEADLVRVTGTATLEGGSVVHIGLNGTYKPLSTYRILKADGGLSGNFADVSSDFAFLIPDLIYDYDEYAVDLRLARNDVDFRDRSTTRNQKATAGGVDSLGPGHDIYHAVLMLPEDDIVIGGAFNGLSGEIHASLKGTLHSEGDLLRHTMNERMRRARKAFVSGARSQVRDWGQLIGERATIAGDGNAAAVTRTTAGMLVGNDLSSADDRTFGILYGYSHSSLDIEERASSAQSANFHLGGYAGRHWSRLSLRSGVAHGVHYVTTQREWALGDFLEQLDAKYIGGITQAFGELGFVMDMGKGSFEPFINVVYTARHTQGFKEVGGAAALSADSESSSTTAATVGVRIATEFNLGGLKAVLKGTVGWTNVFSGTQFTSTHAFKDGDKFTVTGVPTALEKIHVESGLDLNVASNTILGINYSGHIAADTQDHVLSAKLKLAF